MKKSNQTPDARLRRRCLMAAIQTESSSIANVHQESGEMPLSEALNLYVGYLVILDFTHTRHGVCVCVCVLSDPLHASYSVQWSLSFMLHASALRVAIHKHVLYASPIIGNMRCVKKPI